MADRRKYQAQITDQKDFMSKEDYASHCKIRKAIIKTLDNQIDGIERKIEELAYANKHIVHQTELLKSIDGIGNWIALYMG